MRAACEVPHDPPDAPPPAEHGSYGQGRPRIAYHANGLLRLAEWNGTSWDFDVADATNSPTADLTIASTNVTLINLPSFTKQGLGTFTLSANNLGITNGATIANGTLTVVNAQNLNGTSGGMQDCPPL